MTLELLPYFALPLLLVLSALYSGLETASISVSDSSLHERAAKGDLRARRALYALKDRRRVLAVLLVGNNLVNVMAALLLERVLHSRLPENLVFYSSVINFFLITPLLLICGEIVPKHVFHTQSRRAVLLLSPFLQFSETLLTPVVNLCNFLAGLLAAPFGARFDEASRKPKYSMDDVMAMVGAGVAGGDIERAERQMIERIVDLQHTTVREVMRPLVDVVAIQLPETSIEDIKRLTRETGYSRFPVYAQKMIHLEGYIDIYQILAKAQPGDNPADFVRKAHVVPETAKVDALMRELLRMREPAAIVIDEHGGSVGWITLEDALEEIVGEIEDEFDPRSQPSVEQLGDGSMVVPGGLDLDDLKRLVGSGELPLDDDFDTVGGLIFARLGRVPEPGVAVAEGDFEFKVLKMEARKIAQVKVSRLPERTRASQENEENEDNAHSRVQEVETLDEEPPSSGERRAITAPSSHDDETILEDEENGIPMPGEDEESDLPEDEEAEDRSRPAASSRDGQLAAEPAPDKES
jgi:putative hemolysin